MHFAHPAFAAIVDVDPAVRQIHFASADRFDLGAGQDDAGLPLGRNIELMKSLAIGRDDARGLRRLRLAFGWFQTSIPAKFAASVASLKRSTSLSDLSTSPDPTPRPSPGSDRLAAARSRRAARKSASRERRAQEMADLAEKSAVPQVFGEYRTLGGPLGDICAGERVDAYLARAYPFFSRAQWQARVESGEVRVNAQPARKASERLRVGDQLALWHPAEKEPEVDRGIRVISEAGGIMAVHKPPGLPMHENGPYRRNTFAALLQELVGPEWAAVHRLDRETSGIVICAGSFALRSKLTELWSAHGVRKEYLAIARGSALATDAMAPGSVFDVEQPIGDLATSQIRIKKWVVPDGLPASTEFSVLKRAGECALILARPRTGRTNQIRIHAAWSGFPLLGDRLFHPDESVFLDWYENGLTPAVQARVGFHRVALHAARIAFTHPQTNTEFVAESPLPADLEKLWTELSVLQSAQE